MKIKINKEVIAALNPCKERFDNYLESYSNFEGDIQEFLDLVNISRKDKLWVTLRIVPRTILEVFAIDCAFSAAEFAAAAYAYAADAEFAAAAAYAADAEFAAAYAADAAYAALKNEQDNQIAILKYLISEEK